MTILEWYFLLLIIFLVLIILMASGMHIAISFLIINIVGAYIFFGGTRGLDQLILSIYTTLNTIMLLAVPLFIFMGELMFHSGLGGDVIDLVDQWLGRVPGRLGLVAVGSGTILAALTGASMASTSILGSLLVPEMEKRGYKKPMSLGPILGSGGLAVMIPPSGLAILLGTIGEISIGKLLIAIIVPGLLMAAFVAAYIIIRCWLQPHLAPAYHVPPIPISKKLRMTATQALPVAFIIFLCIGVIFLGVATPSEAAATGALATFLVTLIQRTLTWDVLKKSLDGTIKVTGMVFLIIGAAMAFGQILAFSGATQGLSEFAGQLPIAPILVIGSMQIVILIMGCFMEVVSIMLLTLPIFMPVVRNLGFDPVWFGAMYLLNIELAAITPPFGLNLFVMKGVAPSGTTLGDVYRAALPFIGLQVFQIGLMMVFPAISMWLPSMMRV